MKNLITLCLTFLLTSWLSAQTNYYVDKVNGNNNNSGTSLTKAWKTIQKAANSATPNSIVHIRGGVYYESVTVNVSGAAGNPITFRNYQNEAVAIDGTGTGAFTLLTITNKNYLNFQGFSIQNLVVNGAVGLLLETTGSVTGTSYNFKNMIFKNISWTSNRDSLPTYDNTSQPFIAYGRAGGMTNITVDGCQFFDNITGFSESLSLDGNIDGFVVKNCIAHDNTNIGIYIGGNYKVSPNPATDHTRNGVIFNNICYRNVSDYAFSAGIYVDGGFNVVVERNLCYENGYGFEVGCEEPGTTENITVKNNISMNNRECGLFIGGYNPANNGKVLNTTIRNNTFFHNNTSQSGISEMLITKAVNCRVENNIFFTDNQNILLSAEDINPQTGNVINYNNWYTPSGDPNNILVAWRGTYYSTFSSYKTGTGQDANSIFGDPKLVDTTYPGIDLHLQGMSPSKNAGKPGTVVTPGEIDYDGNSRVVGGMIDIGAFELQTLLSALAAGSAQKISNAEDNGVEIYPNPVRTSATITSKAALKNADLKLYTASGAVVRSIQNISGHRVLVERNGLGKGIYFYQLAQGGKVIASGKLLLVD